MTSVMACEVTPDLKFAKIYVSVLGDDEAKEKTMEGLKKSAAYARHQLAHRMNLRNTPELTFILDTSIEYGVEMSKKIRELNHRDAVSYTHLDVYKRQGLVYTAIWD